MEAALRFSTSIAARFFERSYPSQALSRPWLAATLVLILAACTTQPIPDRPSESDRLLRLVIQSLEASSAEERRDITDSLRARLQAAPNHDNLLALTLVQAFTARLPSELQELRADLQVLSVGYVELTDSQRYLAKIALAMVEERLQLGAQLMQLQQKIDSLTEIESSLKKSTPIRATEPQP